MNVAVYVSQTGELRFFVAEGHIEPPRPWKYVGTFAVPGFSMPVPNDPNPEDTGVPS